jgi:hypothetical protein
MRSRNPDGRRVDATRRETDPVDLLEVGRDYILIAEVDGERVEQGPLTYEGTTGMLDQTFHVFRSPPPEERRRYVLTWADVEFRET